MATVVIPHRFRGPATSGNGGYVAGIVGEAVKARFLSPAAEVRLHAPPPIETPLDLAEDGEGIELRHEGRLLAQGRPATLALDVPAPPTAQEALEGRSRYTGFTRHIFPECFVCGTARGEGDGLRIFPGPFDRARERDVAAPWALDASLADAQGRLRAEVMWAALDCPGYGPASLREGRPFAAMLGTLAAEIRERPAAGEATRVLGWDLGQDGRKYFSGTAVFGSDGRLLAKARAVWIALKK